jgi:hypothetical protein
MEQAVTTWKGRPWRRWYVYETDGRRRVVWEETPQGALDKARRSATAAMSERVDPAPPLGTECAA